MKASAAMAHTVMRSSRCIVEAAVLFGGVAVPNLTRKFEFHGGGAPKNRGAALAAAPCAELKLARHLGAVSRAAPFAFAAVLAFAAVVAALTAALTLTVVFPFTRVLGG